MLVLEVARITTRHHCIQKRAGLEHHVDKLNHNCRKNYFGSHQCVESRNLKKIYPTLSSILVEHDVVYLLLQL